MFTKFFRLSCLVSFAFIVCTNVPTFGQTSVIPSRIVTPIDESVRTTIKGTVHPLAKSQFDVGPVDSGKPFNRMILVLSSSPEQEHALQTLLDSQQTKGSPDYHHWLTPEAFGAKFGPSPQDLQQVTSWLQKSGFSIGSIAKSGRWIEFSGTSAQVEAAFRTQMRNYIVNGETHLANATEISLPTALASVVKGVSLHNFFSRPRHSPLTPVHGVGNGTNPNATLHDSNGNVVHALAPGDFAKIYDLNPLYTGGNKGNGQTIAIVGRSDIDLGDMADFQSVFGLPSNPPNVIVNGPDPGDVPGDDVEATLDVEWSNAVAPAATIDFVTSATTVTTDGVDLSAIYIVENNLAPVMSVSFNLCEQALGATENAFINSLAEQAAGQGISVFVSSGDDGPAACDDPNNSVATGPISVGGLSSPPFVTAVGGTEFNETVNGGTDATFWNTTNGADLVSVIGYAPEMVWNESCSVAQCGANAELFAGSGGVSTIYPTPSWQSATGIPGLNFSTRALPDVSLTAALHDGYLLCFQRVCQGGNAFFIIGGTSASSPSMAGIMAVIDQKIGSRQGLANYVLYPLAAAENFSNCNSSNRTNPNNGTTCVFNDITAGNNTVPGATGFNAVTGFDLASGLGSVDANNLATAWATLATGFQGTITSITTSMGATVNITHGQAVTLTAQVQKNPTGAGPTGTIAFVTDKPGPQGGFLTVGAGTLGGSPASFSGSFSNLPGGTYNLRAHYPGDGKFAASDSAGIPVNVAPENSDTALSSIVGFTNSGQPIFGLTINYGDFLDLRTTVISHTNATPPDSFPTGMIALTDNGIPLGSVPLNTKGEAEILNCVTPVTAPPSVPCLTVGMHPLKSSYLGDNSFNPSITGGTTIITVNKGTPPVILSAPASVAPGVTFTMQATINNLGQIVPTGTVQFVDGTTNLGSPATVSGGVASLQTSFSASGNHSITAHYSGDSTYNSAVSTPAVVNVTAPFSFFAPSTSAVIAAGATATYNITLSANGGFTGQVNFTCTGAPGGSSCNVSPSPANLTSAVTSVPLSVTVTNTANAQMRTPILLKQFPFVFAGVLGIVMLGFKRNRRRLLLITAALLVAGSISCGGGSSTPRPPTTATLTLTGTGGGQSVNLTLNLTITH